MANDSLLVSAREKIEYVEESFHIKLREDSCCVEHRVGGLGVIRRSLEGIPWHIVLGS